MDRSDSKLSINKWSAYEILFERMLTPIVAISRILKSEEDIRKDERR